MQDNRRLGRTLRNLGLALLNATLILMALCLWLGLGLASTAKSITSDFAANLVSIDPVRDEIRDLTGELAALRADIATAQNANGELRSQAALTASDKIVALDERFTAIADQLQTIVSQPEVLIDHAIERAATEIKDGIADMRGCTRPQSS